MQQPYPGQPAPGQSYSPPYPQQLPRQPSDGRPKLRQRQTNRDVAALRELACEADTVDEDEIMLDDDVAFRVELAGQAQVDGSTAQLPMKVTLDDFPPFRLSMQLNKRDDGWCADVSRPMDIEASS